VPTVRKESQAYTGDFGSESATLMPDNTIPWQKNAENTET